MESAGVSIERRMLNGRWGQMHVRIAAPTGGERAPPILFLHHTPSSSWIFEPLLERLGTDRLTVAIDTPGYGESASPPSVPTIADYAETISAVRDLLGGETDLFGYHTGCLLAAELALGGLLPVRRLVLAAVPCFDEARRQAGLAEPWPHYADDDGETLLRDWRLVRAHAMAALPFEDRLRTFAEMLRGGSRTWWAEVAVCRYDYATRFPLIAQPCCVLRLGDDLWDESARAPAYLRACDYHECPDLRHGVFQVAPERIERLVRGFLDT